MQGCDAGEGAVAVDGVEGVQGAVRGDRVVVDAEAVAVGVGVAEEAGLENWVCAWFNARDKVAW